MNYSSNAQIHKEAISSSNKLQESLLEAVEILHNGFIANEQISKVIECNIIDDSKKSQGIYTVDYMNSKFEVNCYIEETYNVGDIVFVLIPDGDFAKTKMILGSSDGSGQGINQVTQEELNAAVVTLQRNFQAGVEAIGAACTRKGSPPVSSSLEDTVAAIDAIQTGGNYDTLDVSFGPEGTVYDAADYPSIDAWNIVRIVPPEAPFTVKFFADDRQTILKTEINVPYGGNANCTLLDGTVLNGLYFKGWNPSPINVKADINCYPIRGDYEISSGEIEDNQEAICAVKGAGYPLGSYKALIFSVPSLPLSFEMTSGNGKKKIFTETISSFNVQMHMVKVAEGEDGSTSSWMSADGISVTSNNGQYMPWMCLPELNADGEWGKTQVDWGNMYFSTYLDTHFFSQMPQCLRDAIVSVDKYYTGYASYTWGATTKVEKSKINKIWVPSTKELNTYFNRGQYLYRATAYNQNGWGEISAIKETHGIDYSAIYVPTYTQGFSDRELGFRTSAAVANRYGSWQNACFVSIMAEDQAENYEFQNRIRYWPFGFCLGGSN